MTAHWITPEWPAPEGVRALSTLRTGGHGQGVYASFNLGAHVGDEPANVMENRRRLRELLPSEPVWLTQVHGTSVVHADAPGELIGDASVSLRAGVVCTVMTADCLPILLCDRSASRVAAIHAGWRGLADGVVEAAIEALDGQELMAWLGPAIGPEAFEVGDEVRQAFIRRLERCESAFRPSTDDRWMADLYTLARLELEKLGVEAVYGGEYCTFSDPERFFSYRRDGQTGRMATLIWRE